MDADTLAQVFAIDREAARIEREACAQIAEDMGYPNVAAALRRRAFEETR